MQLYRLCRQRYAELSGFGAKKTGGRWNRKGIAALYTAQNASLAVLEVFGNDNGVASYRTPNCLNSASRNPTNNICPSLSTRASPKRAPA